MRRIIVFLVLFSPLIPSGIVLNPVSGEYQVGIHTEVFHDPESRATIAEVMKLPDARWQKVDHEVPNFGYSSGTHWLRFVLDFSGLTRQDNYILEVGYPPLDFIDFYETDGAGRVIEQISGDTVPFGTRNFNYRNFTFIIHHLQAEKRTHYLRVKTSSSIQLPLTLWREKEFHSKVTNEMYTFGLFYGIMMVMMLYNLFLFLSIRDVNYLIYVGYMMSFTLLQMTLNGFAIQYLWPDAISWNNTAIPVLVSLTCITSEFFAMVYLKLRTFSTWLYRSLQGLILLQSIALVLSFLLPYSAAMRIVLVLVLPTVALIVGSGFYVWHRRFQPARFFILAWVGFLFGGLLVAFKSFGIFPSNFITTYGQQIGAVVEAVLLSLGLGDRINAITREKDAAQKQALLDLTETSDAYSRFVPKEFLRLLEKNRITEVQLGDQIQKNMTVLFIDIRNFTSLSESMTPKENFDFLNSYLRRLNPIIINCNGFIDKYIGDAIMALFPVRPDDAINAAHLINVELAAYNTERARANYAAVEVGMGLHTGSLILGTVGALDRMEGTVISDTVNTAARLESLTKKFNCRVIATEAVVSSLQQSDRNHIRFLGKSRVKGKKEVISLYEVFQGEDELSEKRKLETRELFEAAVRQYLRAQFRDAEALFHKVLLENPNDSVARKYTALCAKLSSKNLN